MFARVGGALSGHTRHGFLLKSSIYIHILAKLFVRSYKRKNVVDVNRKQGEKMLSILIGSKDKNITYLFIFYIISFYKI